MNATFLAFVTPKQRKRRRKAQSYSFRLRLSGIISFKPCSRFSVDSNMRVALLLLLADCCCQTQSKAVLEKREHYNCKWDTLSKFKALQGRRPSETLVDQEKWTLASYRLRLRATSAYSFALN